MVAIFVYLQIGLDKSLRLHPEVFGDPFDVLVCKKRAGGLAAIGTLQTIDAREGLLVQLLHDAVQLFWRPLFEFGEELLVLLLCIFGPIREILQHFFHVLKVPK